MIKSYVKKISDFNNQEVDLSSINITRKVYLENLSLNKQKISYYAWLFLKEKVLEEFNLDIDTLKLTYNQHGKPMFKEFFFNISHSNNYIAIALSNNPVGIDIQLIKEKGIEKLAKKANIDPNNIEEFYKHFSALEAKRKKEGIGIYPSDLKVKVSVTNQSYIYDKDDTYILSIDGDK